MRKIQLFSCLSIFIFASCISHDKDIENIEVDFHGKNASKVDIYVDRVISLETTKESLIGQIDKFRIGFDRIYILDKKISTTLYVFNANGDYINKTVIGKGPGECLRPNEFFLDYDSKRIMLNEVLGQKIMYFDTNLNFLSQTPSNDTKIKNIEKTDKGNYFTLANYNFKEGSFSHVIYNNKLELKEYLIPIQKDYLGYSMSSSISNYQRLLFFVPLDYTIYQFKEGEIIPKYFMDFGSRSLSKSDIEKGRDFVKQSVINENKIDYFDNLFETIRFICFSYVSKERRNPSFCLYSKINKEAYNLDIVIKKSDLPEGNIVGKYKESFVLAVEASDFMSWIPANKKYQELKSKVKISDNNVLFFLNISEKNNTSNNEN